MEEKKVFGGDDAAALVSGLRQRFKEGETRTYEWRMMQLRRINKLIEENEQDIVDALREDLCKPPVESFVQEISMTKASCDFCIKNLKKWMKPEKVSVSITTFPSSAEVVSEPLGVILVISAWNYPFLLSLDPVIGAIAAGNTVVLKPSEISPATSSLFARLLTKYVDGSCIKVVEGGVATTTALLEQKWDKILYTGNGKVGRIVMAAAAKHLTPVVLELGGKSPVLVDSKVDLQVAARRIAVGKWGFNNGQACIAPDYIITPRSFAPKLIGALQLTLTKFYGEEPLKSMDLSHIVNFNHYQRLTRLLDDDKVSGRIVCGGERDENSLSIAPTILLDVPQDSLIMKEEIFGPLLPIITVDKVEDSFDLINSREKPLAAYLFTKDKKLQEYFVERISSGGMCINDTMLQLSNSYLPFGGVGESGTGSYHGKYSFDTFSHKKGVLHRSFGGDASVRYPPYAPKKTRILKAILTGDILGLVLALIGWST